MSLLSGDPLTQAAFSIFENRGVYALLLGSGISRSAEIPTGWEITLDLVRRIAKAQGVEDHDDWGAWYRAESGEEPNYSKLVGELGLSRDERRSILHSYIEPDDLDREEGKKLPTAAHHAIAKLVRSGFIKVIITTNFDRLLENALREEGVEPTVIASTDALQGAEPLAHSDCYILKLHGDYKDARILNTDEELESYPEEYNRLLDRIIDEHGLIVCGWSGEWDHALRAALMRGAARRYSLYWASKDGILGEGAQDIMAQRLGRTIEIDGADSFFSSLYEKVQTLDSTRRQNPLSVELLVASTKRYLAKNEFRIQLEELIAKEAQSLIDTIDEQNLLPNVQVETEEFARRVAIYQSTSESLTRMFGVLGRWGDGSEFGLVADVLSKLLKHFDKPVGGQVPWIGLRTYPVVLAMTGYGLGLIRSKRWDHLHQLFDLKGYDRSRGEETPIVRSIFLTDWDGLNGGWWGRLEGFTGLKTPFSDYLLALFQEWGVSFVGIVPDFEELFETWEILGILAYHESEDLEHLEVALANPRQDSFLFCPVGRSAWHHEMREAIIAKFDEDPLKQHILAAGFAKGDGRLFEASIQNYRKISKKVR